MSEFVEAMNHMTLWGLFIFIAMCAGVQLALSGLRGLFIWFRKETNDGDS